MVMVDGVLGKPLWFNSQLTGAIQEAEAWRPHLSIVSCYLSNCHRNPRKPGAHNLHAKYHQLVNRSILSISLQNLDLEGCAGFHQ